MSTDMPNYKGTTLRRSRHFQFLVIKALLLREVITRYGRHNVGFLWLFIEPMAFTLGVTALWTLSGLSHSSDLPIVTFALTGYSTVLLWRNMPNRCIGSILSNSALMSHRNVRMMDIFLSRIMLEAIGASMSFIALAVVFSWIGLMSPPENTLLLIAAWLLVAWFGASLAITLAALGEQSELVDKIWHPAAYLLFPLSGAAFMVQDLPESFKNVVLWLPMVHGVEMVRDGFFGSKFDAHYSVSYFVIFNLILTFFAVSQERKISKTLVLE